ncbi:hypothetical protein [Aquipuribacter hungaricus]|uniref:Uncharacterized protein n=1 Tax=Aquipuribacter hungaricus TaxID=545624 RepID=A0ABV7WEN8_9MICO
MRPGTGAVLVTPRDRVHDDVLWAHDAEGLRGETIAQVRAALGADGTGPSRYRLSVRGAADR